MSAVDNTLFIALLTGTFTIIGLIIGTLLEFFKDRWRFSKEKVSKEEAKKEDYKKNFLSPLFFHLNKLTIFIISAEKWADIEKVTIYDSIDSTMDTIEELMKHNTYILPQKLNNDIFLYVGFTKALSDFSKILKAQVKDMETAMKIQKIPNGFKEAIQKLNDIFNEMNVNLCKRIYDFMQNGSCSDEHRIYGRGAEINAAIEEIRRIIETVSMH